MLDAKVELDGRLRTVINEFINEFAAGKMTASLPARTSTGNLPSAGGLMDTLCGNVEREVASLRKVLGEYLDDGRMRETLVGAVQDRVIQIYEEFWEMYVDAERRRGNIVSKKGKGREDEVWDVDTFAEWCEGVFRVGFVGLGRDEDDDEEEGSLSGSGSVRS